MTIFVFFIKNNLQLVSCFINQYLDILKVKILSVYIFSVHILAGGIISLGIFSLYILIEVYIFSVDIFEADIISLGIFTSDILKVDIPPQSRNVFKNTDYPFGNTLEALNSLM